MTVVEICKEMGWDYEVYRRQPKWMIDHIIARREGENRYQKFNQLKNGRQ